MAFITTQDRNPFGEDIDQDLLAGSGQDSAYIEGYSDKRVQRELAIRRGERADALPHRLHWARAKTFDGARLDGTRVQHWQANKGYRPLPYDEALKLGYRLDKNAAILKGEDGNAYLQDRMLMVCDAAKAAANYRKVQDATSAQNEQAASRMQQAAEQYEARTGVRPPVFTYLEDREGNEQPARKQQSKK